MGEATPRITAQYLENFSHQTVRILGKVTSLRGEQASIDAGGNVAIMLNRVRIFPIVLIMFWQLVARVQCDKGKMKDRPSSARPPL